VTLPADFRFPPENGLSLALSEDREKRLNWSGALQTALDAVHSDFRILAVNPGGLALWFWVP
jgi:hypothetical protein